MFPRKRGVDVPMDLMITHVRETLQIMSENAPQLGINEEGSYFDESGKVDLAMIDIIKTAEIDSDVSQETLIDVESG